MTGKDGLMRSITEVSFTLDELRLFLDTHPDCEEMLSVFRAKEEERANFPIACSFTAFQKGEKVI